MSAKVKKWIIIVSAVALAVGIVVFLVSELRYIPNCKIANGQDAVGVFERYMDGVDSILESYGITAEPLEIDKVETDVCRVRKNIFLESGETVKIELNYDDDYPPSFNIFFAGKSYTDGEYESIDLSKNRYVFDIASYLCARRVSSEQFYTYLLECQSRVEQRFVEEYDPQEHNAASDWSNFNSAFSYLGSFDYAIEEKDGSGFSNMFIAVSLYE